MGYSWQTPMRRRAISARTKEEETALQLERAADGCYGQAAANRLDGGRVQLVVMPDAGSFSADMIMSQDDARRLVLALAEHLATGSPRVWTKLEGPADDVKQIECCGKRYVRSLADGYWTDLGSPQERMTFSQLRARGDVREVTE